MSVSELPDVVTQALLDVAWLVTTLLHQRPASGLRRWPLHRSEERIPLRRGVGIGWQTGDVDQVRRAGDSLLVEGRNPRREGVHEVVELVVGQRSVHVPVALCEFPGDVIGSQQ